MREDAKFLKPTHRRHNPWHDYSRACVYHITIVVRDRAAVLGQLVEVVEGAPETVCPWGRGSKDGEVLYGKAWMNLTPLGMDVADCIRDIPEYGRRKGLTLRILAQQVMDTHVHFVLYVERDMDGVVLGDLIRGLKAGCNKAYRRRMGNVSKPGGGDDDRGRGTGLFEADYDETILS